MTEEFKLGWLPDLPDHRDLSIADLVPQSTPKFSLADEDKPKGRTTTTKRVVTPKFVDLTFGFPKIENQLNIGSCTANAAVGLIEYLERKLSGKHVEASRLFLYKVTRRLSGLQGDSGAYLRDTIKAMVMFGVSEERFWPYVTTRFDDEPDAFNYALAKNYQTLKYFRVDQPGYTGAQIVDQCKVFLQRGIPLMFGSTVYNGIYRPTKVQEGVFMIPYPLSNERPIGGHAMVLCGYSDDLRAFIVRNSWGEGWGSNGYAYFPYQYVETGLACDIWGITKQEWIDSGVFEP